MLRKLDDFKYFVNCYFDFINTLSDLEKYNINLEDNEEVECFIGSYTDMMSKLLGLEERTNDFKAFQNLIYGKYDNEDQLNEAIEYFWDTTIRVQPQEDHTCVEEQKPKTYFSVDEDEPLPTGHTGAISYDTDWDAYFDEERDDRFFNTIELPMGYRITITKG